ncbi:probable WRKY transcription factor 14 [Oryza brachyantha]|uniref:WRKY domain-containing protein n=1 Tax=Oryza brachyantha TaxID=4533 RepID=J3LUX5_ORYBR|nr:probable WRKY transcription factor 14 [Oryza brachyantha]
MDMTEEEANAASAVQAAAGDLADVVARANARHHHSPLPPPPPMPPHQYYPTIPYDHLQGASELHRPTSIGYSDAAAVFGTGAAPSTVDYSYQLPPSGGYGMPRPLAVQISQCGDVVMAGAAAGAADDGEDATRISPLTPSAHHQMMKRKNEVKKVVCIPAPPATSGRGGGGEVIPSDLWAWRKYGQKPIKGSPYPRGYYRCSSSKGCMARKQVERSRSDPNMLVITYTAEHNHPWPMQRNVLAGYARSHHTHASTSGSRHHHKLPAALQITPCTSSSSSSSSSSCNLYADVLGGQHANMMMMTTEAAAAGLGNGGGLQSAAADEVFAELEELEPDSGINPTMINANMVYSMTSSSSSYDHQRHKF